MAQPRRADEPVVSCGNCDADLAPWNCFEAAFTFSSDDNNDANLQWAEVFERRGVRFTIFTVPRWLGRSGKLTDSDLGALHARGFEIGSHSMTHPRLTQVDDQRLVYELQASRDTLMRIVAAPDYVCRSLAYPFHDHDLRVMAAAERFYLAARDGGLNPAGRPGFSLGVASWDSVSMYEVPLPITIGSLVHKNEVSCAETQAIVRQMIPGWTSRRSWVNVYAHTLSDVDSTHLASILDALLEDGRVWIAPFGTVAAYHRACRCP